MEIRNEQRRLRRRDRLTAAIRSLWIDGGEASNLRESKLAALADKLSYTVNDDFTLLQLDRAVGFAIRQHPDLKATDEEKRARVRGENSPKPDPKTKDWRKLKPEQRLERANEIERLKRLEAQRAKEDSDAD